MNKFVARSIFSLCKILNLSLFSLYTIALAIGYFVAFIFIASEAGFKQTVDDFIYGFLSGGWPFYLLFIVVFPVIWYRRLGKDVLRVPDEKMIEKLFGRKRGLM